MATLTKGKTFTNGETVTPQKLHELVDLGTVSGIVNADIAANAAIADTKLAQITTAGKVLPAAVQGTAVVTADPRLSDARVPVPHGHAISDTTGLQTALDGKATSSHTHDDRYYTETEMNTLLAGKQASGSYAPATGIAQSAVTNLTTDLAGKAASSHTHDDRYYTETEMNTLLAGKQASGSYAPATGIAQSAVTNLTTDLAGKAASSHTHDDRYYTETEMNTLLAGKQASGSYAPATGIPPSAITGTAVVTSDSRLIPTGAIMPFAFNAFAGIPDGWAECNGFAVSRSTYNTLYQVIGTTYGAGDGSTTFNLPDLRGYFIRGSGTNVDGTTSGGFGLKQSDDVKPHVHPFSLSIQSLVLSVQAAFGTRTTGGSQAVSDITVTTGSPSASASISSNSGTETRPKNIAMMYCIKF